jgi:prepilin-type N-terminal cleavage/methylation domain-containing protein
MFRHKRKIVPQSTNPRDQGGFTIIEIVIVLLIIVIIASFVVPAIIGHLKRYNLTAASRNVATSLQRARFLATSNNKRAGISITTLQHIAIEEYDPAGKLEPQVKGAINLPQGVSLADDAPRQIAFDGRGILTPMPKESPKIRVNGEGGYFQVVTVAPTGQVTVSEMQREGQ